MGKKEWTQLWLEYKNVSSDNKTVSCSVEGFDKDSKIIKSALCELKCGLKGILSDEVVENEGAEDITLSIVRDESVSKEGYKLYGTDKKAEILASDENGALYGVFELLRQLSCGKKLAEINMEKKPANPLRMMNHWDNMDGSIERGYSGESFFFENREIVVDERTRDYARFMASVGINGIVINNVNVKDSATYLITDRYFDKVKELSDVFADYGIKTYLSLNFASPIELGGLDICDPLDEKVISWWKEKAKEVFGRLPHLGGFLVKADSEGRPGPFTYGRTQADGANMLGDIVAPYGGIIIWRCFVYNCTQDWRDYKTDRARAGYDYFKEYDGAYHDNVILQIKNGPMDFQIR